MSEIELKFQIPPTARAGVSRAVATPAAHHTPLKARYYDTPEGHLARAGVALRLRLEGDVWVQTLKARGSTLERLEHEVVLAAGPGQVELDLSRHQGHAASLALHAALGDAAGQLAVLFETDVQRCHRVLSHQGGRIELALDVGVVRSGTAELALHEIEFELKSGPVAALLSLVRRWQQRHGLWLDVRSKAERGHLLAHGLAVSAPLSGGPVLLDDSMAPEQALRRIVGACLDHILPNASAVAAGVAAPEHLHQARVGLRRLRTALRLFGAWSDEVDPRWRAQAATLFAALGAQRDQDVITTAWWPALAQAGAPAGLAPVNLQARAAAEDDVAAVLRSDACGALWLALLAFVHGEPAIPRTASGPDAHAAQAVSGHEPGSTDSPALPRIQGRLSTQVPPVLERLQRRLMADALRFGQLDDVQRHSVRKRLKQLRYALEFVGALCRRKAVQRCLARLRPAQEALGEYNDLLVAEHYFRRRAEQDGAAWFAVGWLAAQRPARLARATRALARFESGGRLARRS
jgi:inorganic triphosphatase YgiF